MTIRSHLSVLHWVFLAAGLVLLPGQAKPQQDGGRHYAERQLRLSMAGRGNPWSYLSRTSHSLLLALHEGLSADEIVEVLGLGPDSLDRETRSLETAGLVKVVGEDLVPDFFIADRAEAERAYGHARETGGFLARETLERWSELEEVYADLAIHDEYPLHDLGFFLVGGRILDMGILAALVDEGSLLAHAPARPTPERPDARYYFWGVEGNPLHLGRYGENSTSLGETKWSFATFGANWVDGMQNGPRLELEHRFEELRKGAPDITPEDLAAELGVPFLTREDSERWADLSQQLSAALVTRLMEEGPDIPAFFRTLRAGTYAPSRLPEFMVWYYHMSYAWAIDYLIEEGAIAGPPDEFLAFVLYLEDEGGVLKGV